jgi:hypothetical protein
MQASSLTKTPLAMRGFGGCSGAVTQSIKVIHSPPERHMIQTMAKYKGFLVCQLQIDHRFCT